ncbi:GNAT family N-acetyltransferase [Spongiactinospora sp. TRM90649]|uniref:GNAT family N-acetyltransferase n=1 Tax=Spongiactinospora sp. TRM90649 TaxID=3031114 RepID=UPI0023F6BF92|nr:GNAT family N-acetyltransferase [Spongiactinospora sp. TRM90649]MDF5752001.1 GNAT family N-acetyltransferase [Spongiactinospora sp. TRM90649]
MEIRDLTADDLDAVLDNRKRAFGPVPDGDVESWRQAMLRQIPLRRCVGAFDGPRLVASCRIGEFRQWWHGRPASMAGIGGVAVAPEERGRGVGGLLLRAAIERSAELGHTVSVLFPATTPVYRGLGWEHVGAQHVATFPAEALRAIGSPDEPVKLRRLGPDDVAEVIAIIGRVHSAARASGPVCWDEATWREWLGEENDLIYGAEDGFLLYRWDGGDIDVDTLVAGSHATARAMWSLVGSSSSVAKSVRACVAPDDPVFWMLRERSRDEVAQVRWMFRLIDVPAAVAGRGFPGNVTLDTVLTVDDPQRPANSGAWRLEVAGGEGRATRAEGGEGTRVSIGGLSALFGGVPAGALRRSGRLHGGGPAVDEALEAAFRGAPYMLDYF